MRFHRALQLESTQWVFLASFLLASSGNLLAQTGGSVTSAQPGPGDTALQVLNQPDTPQSQYQKAHPTAVALRPQQNKLRFRNADGTVTMILGAVTHQDSQTGAWTANAPVLSQTSNGWRLDGSLNNVLIRANGTSSHTVTLAYPDYTSKHTSSLALTFPTLNPTGGMSYQFTKDGLTWDLRFNSRGGFDFSAPVAKRQGAKSYVFQLASSESLNVDTQGQLVGNTHVGLTRAMMIPKSGKSVQCSAWTYSGGSASFTCDDTVFKDAQLPYLIDPGEVQDFGSGPNVIIARADQTNQWSDDCGCYVTAGIGLSTVNDPFSVDIDTSNSIPSGASFVSASCGYDIGYSSTTSSMDSLNCAMGTFNPNGTTQLTFSINLNYWNANDQNVVFSDWFSFSDYYIYISLQPGPVTLVSPANGATGVSTTPTLTWLDAVAYDYYTLDIGTSSSPGWAPMTGITTTSGTPTTPLAAGTTYYWNIAARTDAGPQTLSPTWHFTTAAASPPQITTTSVPNGVQGLAYSQTLTATGGNPAYTWAVASGSLPTGLSLAASTGVLSGTPTASGAFSFTIRVTDSTSQTATKSLTLTVAAPVSITTSSLPNGVVGTAWSTTLAASGGNAPLTWSATGLPGGLSINASTGQISGTPTATATGSVTVTATDSTSPTHATVSKSLALTIAPALTISTSSLPAGAVGAAYSTTVTAAGGNTAYTWSTTGLPSGFSINSSTGQISGTPTAAATTSITVTVTDSTTPTHVSASAALSLVIAAAPAITTSSLPNGVAGAAFATTLAATGGNTPYNWSATGLPSGLSINSSTGQISGTPSSAATSSISATVTDSTSGTHATASKTLSLTVATALTITTSSLPGGMTGTAYSATPSATGGNGAYTWSATGLPAGLSINSSSGQISGTPTAAGSATVTLRVTDSTTPTAVSVSVSLSLIVVSPPAITTSSLPNGVSGTAYSLTLAATGGNTPYTWSATGLPSGLSINTGTGVISGTTTAVGAASVSVTLTDSTNPTHLTASTTLSLTIAAAPAISTASLPPGAATSAYAATLTATGGNAPYTWSATGLPAGLAINSSTGAISGTPTQAGTSSVSITVTDSTTPTHATASATLSLAIAPALTITTTALPGGVNGVAYSATAGATGGNTPYSWSATGLPSGLTINSSTGAISGTTSANGSASVTLRVADSSSPAATTSATFQLTISAAGTVTLTAPANQAVGQSTTPTLTWTAATNATSYTLYLDTVSPPVATYTVSGTSYTPSTALAIGQPYYWYVVPVNGSASGQPSPTWTFWTAGPPSGTSVSPASGGPPAGGLGTPTPFTFTFSSPNGWQQLWTEVEFNYYNFGSGACLIGFWPATQQVALMSDHAVDGWQWIGTLGQTQTEPANSQCSVSLDQTQSYMTVVSPTTIQLRLTIAFQAGMPGPQQIWAQSGDNQGNTAYWQQLGTWTTSVVNNARPTTGPEGVKSGSWTGGGDTFTYQAASANGWAYLTDFTAAFAASGAGLYPGPHICRVDYSRLSNTISLETDNGVGDPAAQSVPLGSNQILSNSQCTLNVGQSSTQVVDANTLQWNVALTFNTSWTTKSPTDYFYIFDRQYQGPVEYTNTGWAEAGPYNITAPSTIVTSNPPGLTVTVDGTGCTTPCTFQWGAATQHTISAPATMSGTGVQGTFASWSDGGAATHTVTATASSTTYTATYANIQYYLTTAVSPAGAGTVSPASGWYNAGAQVTITASAASGQQFSSFAGTSNGLSNPMTVTMTQAVTETAQFTTATPIFTVLPQPPPPYGWQPVQQGVPLVYTVLPPAGYIGTIQLGSASSFSCSSVGAQVTGVNVSGTGNPDGSLTVTVTEDTTIFPLSPCYQRKAGNNVYFTLNLNVYGINPNVSQESFQLPIQVLLATPTVSISPSLVSKTATTATYVETVSTQGYTGPVTLGLQSGSCATILGSTPTVQLTGSGSTNMPITLSTAGCAAGTNTAVTFTGTGSGTSAPPVTLLLQTAPASAVMTSPPPGATIRGGATTFSWSTVTGATYSLSMGSTPGAGDIYQLVTTSPSASATLPANAVVYAKLGTQSGGVWQYQQFVYKAAAARASQTLTVSKGPSVARVGNNGTEVQYTYYFAGGDATQVTHVATSLDGAGVTSRIVSQTPSTVTIGLSAAKGMTPRSMALTFCDPGDPDEACPVGCNPETDSSCIQVPGGGGGGGVVDTNVTVYPTEVSAAAPGVPVILTFGLSWDSSANLTIESASLLGNTGTVSQTEGDDGAWVTITFNTGINSGWGCGNALSIQGSYLLGDGTSVPFEDDVPICVDPYEGPPVTYTISGKVTANGKPLANITITADIAGTMQTFYTDSQGDYSVSQIPACSPVGLGASFGSPYKIAITADGPAKGSFWCVQANQTQNFTAARYTTVYVLHGIGQSSVAMVDLWSKLVSAQGLDLSRFYVDASFDFSECAAAGSSCNASCSVSAGGQKLATQWLVNAPWDVVLVGYSMGGLIARDALVNGYTAAYGNFRSSVNVRGLVTLGTPHWGYAFDYADELAQCPQLVLDMSGAWNTVTHLANPLSPFLSNLSTSWQATSFGGYWLAAAGRFCSSQTRWYPSPPPPSIQPPGCLEGTYSNDGVVCADSANYSYFDPNGPVGKPTLVFDDPQHKYSHTDSTAGLGTALVMGCATGSSNGKLYKLIVGEDPFNQIVTVINGN